MYFDVKRFLRLWSSLSFTLFALSNALVFTDSVVLPDLVADKNWRSKSGD